MYKKLLLASSIAVASGAVNSAVLFAPQDAGADDIISHTSQGIIEAAAPVESTNYLLTLGSEYVVGDIFSLTYSTPIAGNYTPPASIVCDEHVKDRLAGVAASDAVVTFGLLSATTSTLNYRVSALTAAGLHTGAVSCVLPKVMLDETAAATITSATMTFDAQTASGVALDSDPAAVTIATVVDQFAAGVVNTAFNATVDVTADRKKFTDTGVTDQMKYTISAVAGDSGGEWSVPNAGNPSTDTDSPANDSDNATVSSVTNSVVASTGFAFADTTDAAGILISNVTVDAQTVTDEALSIDGKTLTYGGTLGTAQTLDLDLGASGGTLPVQSYTISSSILYDTDKTRVFPAVAAGAFGLNATSVTVYGVPFSAGVVRMLWASNGSAIDGAADATIYHDGVSMGPYDLGTVAAGSNVSLNSALEAAVTAAGDTLPTTGRGDITFTITSSDTKVLASYYKDADRQGLESSDTLNSDQVTP
jgi:hypothetical protein